MRWCIVGTALAWYALTTQSATAARQSSQSPSEAQPTFRSGVGLVRVDVTVMGRNGIPVSDLTADDFEIREDGRSQQVQLVQFHSLSGEPAPDDTTSLEIRSPDHARQEAAREDVRLVVVFIDDYHLRYGAIHDHQLRRGLHRFIEKEMRPTDLFAVMGPLTPLSDLELTRDRRELFERIDRIQGHLGGFVPPRSPVEEAQLAAGRDLGRIRAQISLSALESLVVFLGGLREGRKTVLLVSQGPPITAGGLPLFDDLKDIIIAANRSNVTIHAVDPRELDVGRSFGGSVVNESLTAETGGRLIAQSNDFASRLDEVMADASAYYLVGYTPAREAADGRFHEINVRVKRKDVRVLARRGYWAPTPEELTPAPVPTVSPEIEAAMDGLSRGERARILLATLGAAPLHEGRSTVTVSCELAPGADAGTVRRVHLSMKRPDGSRLAQEAEVADAPGRWHAAFEAVPGTTDVVISAENTSGDIVEEVIRRVTVPEVATPEAIVGTALVYRPPTPAAHRALLAGAGGVPTARRHFRRTERVLVRVPVAEGSVLSTTRTELVNPQGQVLTELEMIRAAGSGEPMLELPLGSLAFAPYLLRVSLTVDGQTATQLIPFEVVR
jgi:VWFA-related protein